MKVTKAVYKSIYKRAFGATDQQWYKIATIPSSAVDNHIQGHVAHSPWFEFLVLPKNPARLLPCTRKATFKPDHSKLCHPDEPTVD